VGQEGRYQDNGGLDVQDNKKMAGTQENRCRPNFPTRPSRPTRPR
jgi:hypothetical protein